MSLTSDLNPVTTELLPPPAANKPAETLCVKTKALLQRIFTVSHINLALCGVCFAAVATYADPVFSVTALAAGAAAAHFKVLNRFKELKGDRTSYSETALHLTGLAAAVFCPASLPWSVVAVSFFFGNLCFRKAQAMRSQAVAA